MAMRQFTLTQLRDLIAGNEEHLVGNYISQNLVITRNVQSSLIVNQFAGSPTLLPEMRILHVKQGQAHMTLNMIDHWLEAGDLLYLGTHGIVQYHEASSDLQAIGISMSDELFQLAIGNSIPRAFDGHLRDFHLHLAPDEASYYDCLHLLLNQHILTDGHSSQVTLHLTSALLWYVNHLWQQQEQTHLGSLSREQRMFTDFIRLVNEYAPEHHTIDFYASRLCLTPRYLSSIITRQSGKSAKQWIDDALVTLIKIELKHSDKPIAQIADDMHFPSASFLTKFFKRKTGLTPTLFQHS